MEQLEYLGKAIYNGYLRLRCPSCNGVEWSVSEVFTQTEVLYCDACVSHEPVLGWVTVIKRVGDSDLWVNLAIEKRIGGYFLCVDPLQRNTDETEGVRFCNVRAGGQSPEVFALLSSLLTNGESRLVMKGEGGELVIYRGRGDNDVWMKTVRGEVFHGANILFTEGHEFTVHIPKLIKAILSDMKHRTQR